MNTLFPILAIVGGLIAASSFVIAKKPDAKELFDKMAPYQGFLGVGMVAMGVIWLLQVLPHIGSLLKAAPASGAVTIATLAGTILVGFLLGYGLLSKLLFSKSEAAAARGEAALVKITKVQVPLGLITAGCAAASFIL